MSDNTQPSETFDRNALAEDARALVSTLEAVHPDPYIGYDGRVDLHARLERIVRNLPDMATAEEFYRRAAPLVAGMEDAHSVLHPPDHVDTPDGSEDNQQLPVSFRIVGDRLYIDSVFTDAHADLIGARLLGVEDESVETLTNRGAALRGAENQYTALLFASRMIEAYTPLTRLLDQSTPPAEPTILVEVDGEDRSVALPPVAADREPSHELDKTVSHPTGTGPRYRLYEGGDAAVFVPGDLSGYRESLEDALDRGAARVEDLAPTAYDRHLGGDRPETLAEMVAALPSMSETLTAIADEMVAADTETLIIDLRGNTGGDSTFVFHLAYILQGWEGVARTVDSIRALERRTEAHRERYGTGGDGSEDLGTAEDNPADYDFSDFLSDPGNEDDEPASRIRDRLMRSDTFAAVVEARRHETIYQPAQLIVAVSASTLSSAFAGAAQLTSLGADIVGVPSGQAPLSFGEHVEETLPNTGLTARIAGSLYHWVPDPDTNVLQPDRELTPTLFERYDRAADAGLRLAFDHAGITEPSSGPPEPVEE